MIPTSLTVCCKHKKLYTVIIHDSPKKYKGEKGLFIAMPSRKAADGEYRDIAHPINSDTRDRIQRLILERYQETLAAEGE